MLSTDTISVSYDRRNGARQILDLTLSLSHGQITAVVGPNGSGKSTLIKTLSRVLQPISGAVMLDGRNLYTHVSSRTSAQFISVVPQDTHIAFDFTSRDLVRMGLSPYRSGWAGFSGDSAEDRDRIERALNDSALSSELSDRPVMTLSGGERQRALLARALIQDAPIILLDEPTASLDLSHQADLFKRLLHLAKHENKAVLVVLHDLNLAAQHADRLVVLDHGAIVADGAPEDIVTSDLIERVYHVTSAVGEDIATGRVHVTILTARSAGTLAGLRINVLCGGGGGSSVLRCLVGNGASLKIGYLNEGDIDLKIAELFNIQHLRLGAFEPIPFLGTEWLVDQGALPDAVVVCPSAITSTNIEVLNTAKAAAAAGVPVFSLLDSNTDRYAGSGGNVVSAAWSDLICSAGFMHAAGVDNLISLIIGVCNA